MCEGEGGGKLHARKRSCIKPALCFYRKEPSKKFYDVITATSKKRIPFKRNKGSILHLIFETLYNGMDLAQVPWKTGRLTALFWTALVGKSSS